MIHIDINQEQIPALGFGTYRLKGKDCRDAVTDAISLGYRHIDTARMYDNETEVGRGIRDSSVNRDDVFVTTKIWYTDLARQDIIHGLEDSLRQLQTDYVNLTLIHWPTPEMNLEESLGALMELQQQGKTRLIGVSNFPSALLKEALSIAPIVCNQVEYHPYLAQDALLDIAQERRLMLTAFCPLAKGEVLQDNKLKQIGEKYGKSAAQITLRWLVQQENVVAIPKAASREHRVTNLDIFDFSLTEDEMSQIHQLNRNHRLSNPSWAPVWD